MPSPRPMTPSFSLVVAFTPTAIDRDAGDLGDARAHRVAVRIDLGASQTTVDVEMAITPPRVSHALDREREEAVRRRAAPLRVARRKVHADVAVGERAEDRVGQRMQHDVGVGMAGELRSCGMRTPPSQT